MMNVENLKKPEKQCYLFPDETKFFFREPDRKLPFDSILRCYELSVQALVVYHNMRSYTACLGKV